jgi:hypothetical protein
VKTQALGDDGDVLDAERGAACEHVAQRRGLVEPEERVLVDERLEAVPAHAPRPHTLEGDGARAVEEEALDRRTWHRGRGLVELRVRGRRGEPRDREDGEGGGEPRVARDVASATTAGTMGGSGRVLQRRFSALRDGSLGPGRLAVEWLRPSREASTTLARFRPFDRHALDSTPTSSKQCPRRDVVDVTVPQRPSEN